MSLAGEIVDGIAALIGAGVKLDAETRAAAKQEVRDIIERAELADKRDLLGVVADEITARHLARVRAIDARAAIRGSLVADPADVAPQGALPPDVLSRALLRIVDEEDGG